MNFYGSTLSYPFRPDQRGMLATVSDPEQMVAQTIIAIMRTRKGERLMMPELGIEDPVFGVVDVAYAVRTAYDVVRQVRDYVKLVNQVRAEVWVNGDPFAGEQKGARGQVAISIYFTVSGTNSEFNLTFPSWGLRGAQLHG